MVFLLESLPFELTFRILFQHSGFDALETIFGRHVCWELRKLMDFSRRAELLCICRTVQLLDHPAHALFLLNYPPNSSIPANRRAWDTAVRCCVGWAPDVQAVVLAMRAFLPSTQEAFPWLSTALLAAERSAEEWRRFGAQLAVCCRFNSWWWNCQREAFQLERVRDMGAVIANTARAETGRLFNALRRREMEEALRLQRRAMVKKMRRDEDERRLRGVKTPIDQTSAPLVLSYAKKRNAEQSARDKEKALHAILDTVQRACSSPKFAPKLERIARLIVSIEKTHPLIKWNLRLLFHTAAQRAGRTLWDMEFMLHGLKWDAVEEGAVGQLEGMWAGKRGGK